MQMLPEIARFAFTVDKITQRRTAVIDRGREYVPDGLCQSLITLPRDSAGGTQRVDARSKQRLVGIDIPHARKDVGIHDELLDGNPPATGFFK
jgi:hypothetical protein